MSRNRIILVTAGIMLSLFLAAVIFTLVAAAVFQRQAIIRRSTLS